MSKKITKELIFEFLNSWDNFEIKEINEKDEAYEVLLGKGNKRVLITMPYEVGEFFLDFIFEDEPYYSDWYEIMDDSIFDFMSYTKKVVENYLHNRVKVKTRGWWVFKVHDLLYYSNGEWRNVFAEQT